MSLSLHLDNFTETKSSTSDRYHQMIHLAKPIVFSDLSESSFDIFQDSKEVTSLLKTQTKIIAFVLFTLCFGIGGTAYGAAEDNQPLLGVSVASLGIAMIALLAIRYLGTPLIKTKGLYAKLKDEGKIQPVTIKDPNPSLTPHTPHSDLLIKLNKNVINLNLAETMPIDRDVKLFEGFGCCAGLVMEFIRLHFKLPVEENEFEHFSYVATQFSKSAQEKNATRINSIILQRTFDALLNPWIDIDGCGFRIASPSEIEKRSVLNRINLLLSKYDIELVPGFIEKKEGMKNVLEKLEPGLYVLEWPVHVLIFRKISEHLMGIFNKACHPPFAFNSIDDVEDFLLPYQSFEYQIFLARRSTSTDLI